MIEPKELLRLRRQQPFQPLRVHLKDGRVFEIPMPGLMVVGTNYLDVGILRPGEKLPIAEYVETLPIADIVRVEIVSTTVVQVYGEPDSCARR